MRAEVRSQEVVRQHEVVQEESEKKAKTEEQVKGDEVLIAQAEDPEKQEQAVLQQQAKVGYSGAFLAPWLRVNLGFRVVQRVCR